MKQILFMLATALLGTAGSFLLSPVYGFAVYYMYAVLRPEVLWDWSLPPGYRWSFVVAIATMLATAVWRAGLFTPLMAATDPWYGTPKYTRTHYLFLAFVAWICLTYPTAYDTDHAFEPFVEYVKIFAVFVAATFALRRVSDLWTIYMTVTVSTLYVAYEVNYHYLVNKWMILMSRGIGGLDNNGAALMFAMAIPLCFFAWEATRGWYRWGFLAGIPFLLHAIMLSFSRGAMLTAGVAGVAIFVRSRNKRFLTLLYGLAFVMILGSAGKEVRDRFVSISQQDVDESANSRKTTWKIAIKMAMEKPIFGYGIRNSQLFTFAYGADIPNRAIHSQYLQTAADSGLVALALYLALLVSVFRGLREVRRFLRPWNDPESERVKALTSGLECGLIAFCFGAVFLSLEHFELPYIMMLLSVQLHAITRAIQTRLGPRYLLAVEAASAPRPRPRPVPRPAARAAS